MPLTAEDQTYLKKYIGSDYVKYNSILRGRADKLFLDSGEVSGRRIQELYSGHYEGFRGLLDTCVGIVRAMAKIPMYTGPLATRGVNNYKQAGHNDLLFYARQLAVSHATYSEPAFMSTSAGKCMWPRDILVHIDLTTSSSHGGRILGTDAGAFAGEAECLFLPAAPFKVVGAEQFSGSTHREFIDEEQVTIAQAEERFKFVLHLEAQDYPESELDPATASWYMNGEQYARNFEQRARGELLDLAMREDDFQPTRIIVDDIRTVAEKMGLRRTLDSYKSLGMIDDSAYEQLLIQNQVTDIDLRALGVL